MKKTLLLIIVLLMAIQSVAAQDASQTLVRFKTDAFIYSGPGTNAGYAEYVASGREVLAVGRSSTSDWIQINVDQAIVAWVAADDVTVVQGELALLPVREGLLDIGGGMYAVDNDALRAAEVQMIVVQRAMRFIGARWFRLQDNLGTSCQNIPTAPRSVRISDAHITQVPELERVRRELEFARSETALAIQVFQLGCEDTNPNINLQLLQRGIMHINNAYNAYDVVRKYMNELAGLEPVTR